MNDNWVQFWSWIAALAIVGLCSVIVGCDDPKTAQRVLEDEGMKNIQLDGYSWRGCSDDDMYSTKFTATNLAGKRVTGVVCSDPWKGTTIRYF